MTGADFKYLLATAQVESNLNPNAQASTSSARGLFQFTEQTWLTTLKEQGAALGYGPYANAISRQPSGDYAVADPRMTDAVMNLRSDPTANALMAGAFTKANAGKLAEPARPQRRPRASSTSRISSGSTGASRLIGLADTQPADAGGGGVSGRGARQSDDLLRRARQRPQRRRGLSHAGRPLRRGARRRRRHADRDRRRRRRAPSRRRAHARSRPTPRA